jgi:predicted P-loop ATPase/GTPase
MSIRKQVYAEEYLAAHNRELNGHPKYRNDMEYTQVLANGTLVMNTRDKVLTPEDRQVFDEVCKTVDQSYKLIIP